MSGEGNEKEKLSPAERVRAAAAAAERRRAEEAAAAEAQRVAEASAREAAARDAERVAAEHAAEAAETRRAEIAALRERLATAELAVTDKQREIAEIQSGIDAIRDEEKKGPLSGELLALEDELTRDLWTEQEALASLERARDVISGSPAYREILEEEQAAREAEEAERARAEVEEKEARYQTMRQEIFDGLARLTREAAEAVRVGKEENEGIKKLRKDREKLEKDYKPQAQAFERKVQETFYAVPEKQRNLIEDAYREAKESVYHTELQGRGDRFTIPAARSFTRWLDMWRNKVTPSPIPFFDKPLRALLALEASPELAALKPLWEAIDASHEKDANTFRERDKRNQAFAARFMAEDSPIRYATDYKVRDSLRYEDRTSLDTAIQELRRVTHDRDFHFAINGVGNDLYREMQKSGAIPNSY